MTARPTTLVKLAKALLQWKSGCTALRNAVLPRALAALGLFVDLMVALGFSAVPGLLRNVDAMAFIAPLHSFIWNVSSLGLVIVFPVWRILRGRFVLSNARADGAHSSA